MLKNGKIGNRNGQQNRKTDLNNGQTAKIPTPPPFTALLKYTEEKRKMT